MRQTCRRKAEQIHGQSGAAPHLEPRRRTGQELEPLPGMKEGSSMPDAPSMTLSIPNFSSFKVAVALRCFWAFNWTLSVH